MRIVRFVSIAALLPFAVFADEPWKQSELLPPANLAATLRGAGAKPVILFVGFPVLYKGAHIPGAVMVGPGEKGGDAIRKALEKTPKNAEVVLYCGCCPMDRCPNVRPAVKLVKELGYQKVRLLDIPTNMNTDWVTKGYPTEKAAGTTGF